MRAPAGHNLRMLTGTANPELATTSPPTWGTVARMLLDRFSDGEVQVKIEESLRGMDAFVVQPTSLAGQ